MTYALIHSRTWDDYYGISQPDTRPLQMLLAAGGRFGLREAVLVNDVQLARVRLNQGADPNTGRDLYEGPLLKIAAELGYLEIVKLLLDRGADLEATDDLGQRALMREAHYGRLEIVSCLLDQGAEINAVDWTGQSTSLMPWWKARTRFMSCYYRAGPSEPSSMPSSRMTSKPWRRSSVTSRTWKN